MITFTEYLIESAMKWNGYPTIGWWKDQKILVMYHGTHERNIKSMLSDGINRPDPKTGMISMAFEPNTAFGYASMSGAGGEADFRTVGAKVTTTPAAERAVIVAKMPMRWILSNMDSNLSGNLKEQKAHLQSKDMYDEHQKKYDDDQSYYALCELRFKTHIPSKFLVGYTKK
jgi:hypothetical protein